MALASRHHQAAAEAHRLRPHLLQPGRLPQGDVRRDRIAAVVLLDGRSEEPPDPGPGLAARDEPGARQDEPGVEPPGGTPEQGSRHAELEAGDHAAGSYDTGQL